MAQVKVTSLDALESFRSRLILFLTKAGCSVSEVIDEVNRTRYWLQNDQRMHWEREFRRRTKILEQAEQELMTARLSNLRDTAGMQKMAVLKAKKALAEAEEKRRLVKQWNRNFGTLADPLTKKLESIRGFLDHDLPKGVTFLASAQKTLEDYTQPTSAGPAAPATADGTAADVGQSTTADPL